MARHTLLLLLLLSAAAGHAVGHAAATAATAATAARLAAYTTSTIAPEQVRLALGLSPASMAVAWATMENTPAPIAGSEVQWGLYADLSHHESATGRADTFHSDPGRNFSTHTALMTGLRPSTRYYYRVGSSSGPAPPSAPYILADQAYVCPRGYDAIYDTETCKAASDALIKKTWWQVLHEDSVDDPPGCWVYGSTGDYQYVYVNAARSTARKHTKRSALCAKTGASAWSKIYSFKSQSDATTRAAQLPEVRSWFVMVRDLTAFLISTSRLNHETTKPRNTLTRLHLSH